MPEYVYVYVPVTGAIVGTPSGYCTGGPHPFVCVSSPYDISCGAGAAIIFKASSQVKSIQTTYYSSGVCFRGSEVPTPWDAQLKVDFYLNINGQGWIGKVCYAHVNSPVSNGIYNVNTKTIGFVPSNCSCACASGCKCGGYQKPPLPGEKGYCASQSGLCAEKCPCRCCYGGTHVHMEGDGLTNSLGCGANVSGGVTWIYRWSAI
jgi:hypothetical protein